MQNQVPTRKWTYLLIELLIVTTGVLIALGLDQWIDNQRERSEEALHLRAARAELQQMLDALDSEVQLRDGGARSVERVFALSAADSPPKREELDPLLGDLLWWAEARLAMGAIESILVSGKLRIIRNEDIRFFLAGLPAWLKDVRAVEGDDYNLMVDSFMPFMSEHSNLTQLANSTEGFPVEYPTGVPRDHALLLRNTVFLNLLVQRGVRHLNVRGTYDRLRQELVRVIGLLDAELK